MDNGRELKRLCKLMNDEIYIFRQLLKIEKLKNSLIINQEIDELKKITAEEEKYLDEVAEKEKERESIVERLFRKYKVNSEKVLSTLIKILPDDVGDIKQELKQQKCELIRSIKDLKKMNVINNQLLMDSIKFFNYAVNSLQSIESITYTNGSEKNKYNKAQIIDRQV